MEGTEITFWWWDIDIGDRGWERIGPRDLTTEDEMTQDVCQDLCNKEVEKNRRRGCCAYLGTAKTCKFAMEMKASGEFQNSKSDLGVFINGGPDYTVPMEMVATNCQRLSNCILFLNFSCI